MIFQNLRDFLRHLDRTGQLVRVREPVSVDLEMAEIADRTMKLPGGGPALFFEKPVLMDGTISDMPVAINIFGSWRRMAAALGVRDVEEHARRIAELIKPEIPKGLWGKMQMLPKLAELAKVPPRPFKGKPPCQAVILREGEFDLTRLPVLRTWPLDGGPFITLPMVVTRDPQTGIQNIGMYRMQVFGPDSTGMHWQRHKGGAAHYRAWKCGPGGLMPVVVAIGGDPATMYTPSAPLPPGIDEYLFGGFLRREPVYTAKAITTDLTIPAQAEIVLEGYVDTDEELAIEGPFGDHTGFYTLEELYPTFHVTTVTMREDPVYPATLVGRPPVEDVYLGGATERIFLPLAKLTIPEIVDYHMPPEGVFHNLVFVSIRKEYPGQAFKVMNGLWGLGLMSLAKVIVVVDEWIDVRNVSEAWWYALGNIDPERDVRFTMGPVDVLDHSSRGFTYGSKMGIDGTRKWSEEGFTRPWPEMIEMSADVKEHVDALWSRLGIEAID
ncbi:MAG TPA: menaquinone biosynthesis decarboxylase [Longimicrobium sp.]|nr:menaquinone biosynthesis decarboxylase [Longimicrobium sp.]